MVDRDQLVARFGKTCTTGEVLFREGDPGNVMYVVQSGRVRLSRTAGGTTTTLSIIGPGDFFGELAILTGKPRVATAEAMDSPTVLLVIDAKMFETMVLKNAEIALRLIQKLARRLDAADALVGVMMHHDPKAKVILALCHQAEQQGVERDDGSIWLALTTDELAALLGLDPAEIHGVLMRLIRLAIIEKGDGGIVVRDVKRLRDFLDFLETRAHVQKSK